jgi:hypothetical protein
MEKNAILKAESLAAAKMISVEVEVDPEALNCPKCLRPLAPPVFEVHIYSTIPCSKLFIRSS